MGAVLHEHKQGVVQTAASAFQMVGAIDASSQFDPTPLLWSGPGS